MVSSIHRNTVMLRISVILLYFVYITGQVVINEECKKHVNDAFDAANTSFVIPSNFSIPSTPSFDEINELLKRLNALLKNIGDFDDLRDREIESNILNANQTDQLKTGIGLLKAIYKNIENVKTSRNNTKETCQSAKVKYNGMIIDFDGIEKIGNEVNKSVSNISIEVDKIKERSILIQNDFQSLKIPDFTATKYLCNKLLGDTIQEIVFSAQRIQDILMQKKEKLLSKLKDFKEKIGEIKRPGDIPKTIFKDGNKNTIKKLQKELADLKNRVDKLKQLEDTRLNWANVISKLKEKLKGDIEMAKRVKDILNLRDKSKQSYEDIQKIVKGLYDQGVCTIKGPVDIEQ